MIRIVIVLIFIFSFISCIDMLKSQQEVVNKRKWATSSSYRYEVAKKSDFYKFFEGKPRSFVTKYLGNSWLINDFEKLYYCLDIKVVLYYDDNLKKEICCKCMASNIAFYFDDEGRVVEIVTGWVEPLNN